MKNLIGLPVYLQRRDSKIVQHRPIINNLILFRGIECKANAIGCIKAYKNVDALGLGHIQLPEVAMLDDFTFVSEMHQLPHIVVKLGIRIAPSHAGPAKRVVSSRHSNFVAIVDRRGSNEEHLERNGKPQPIFVHPAACKEPLGVMGPQKIEVGFVGSLVVSHQQIGDVLSKPMCTSVFGKESKTGVSEKVVHRDVKLIAVSNDSIGIRPAFAQKKSTWIFAFQGPSHKAPAKRLHFVCHIQPPAIDSKLLYPVLHH